MDVEILSSAFWVVLGSLGLLLLFVWAQWYVRKHQIGEARCNRCGHVGPLSAGAGDTGPVCARCKSQDWLAVKKP